MLTRCPGCSTTFRITPEQLKAKQGRVRCGHCQLVFNAIETLEEAATRSTMAPEQEPIAVSAAPTLDATARDAIEFQEQAPAEDSAEFGSADIDEPVEPSNLAGHEPAFSTLLPEPKPRLRWPWVLGAVVAFLGLSAQGAYYFRTEIAIALPQTKPAIQGLCAAAGCDLPLPRKADLIGIETSDLHPEPSNPGRLQLAAGLKNRAPFAQQYPHFEITLTDSMDKAVVRRVLSPAEYLPKTIPEAEGFGPGRELAINLSLDVKDVAIVGYRLYIFYP